MPIFLKSRFIWDTLYILCIVISFTLGSSQNYTILTNKYQLKIEYFNDAFLTGLCLYPEHACVRGVFLRPPRVPAALAV